VAGLKVSVDVKKNLTQQIIKQTKSAVGKAVKTVAQDFARTVSETAPHRKGDLESSYSISYAGSNSKYSQATIEFSIRNGGFNYAIAMHEWTYKLGKGSLAKGGGTGMSNRTYPVGNKYMTRVLEGERETYEDYIKKKFQEALGKG